jgi:heme A synthase
VVAFLLIVGAPRIALDDPAESGGALGPGGRVALLAAVQAGLGFLNVLLLAPVWLQLTHLLIADLLWIAIVLLGASVLAARAPAAARPDGYLVSAVGP